MGIIGINTGVLCAASISDVIANIFDFIVSSASVQSMYYEVSDYLIFKNDDFTTIELFYDYFLPWAYYMLLIFFLVQLSDTMTRDNMTIEILVKHFLKLLFGFVFLKYGKVLVSSVISLGNAAVKYGEDVLGVNDAVTLESKMTSEIASELGIWSFVVLLAPVAFLWLVSTVIGLVLKFQLFTRKFEMCMRLGFAPLAFSDVMGGQGIAGSNAVRYLKRMLALALQGAAVLMVFAVAINLRVSNTNDLVAGYQGQPFMQALAVCQATIDEFAITACVLGGVSAAKQVLNEALS